MLSFNASTVDKDEFVKIRCPCQIMPGGRNTLSSMQVSQFKEMSNHDVLIHASYVTRPFSMEISNITRLNLKNYVILAKKLGTRDILIHMPSSMNELTNFGKGLQLINEVIINDGCICHLETNPLTKDLIQHLGMNKENAYEKYQFYTESIWESIPKKYRDRYRIVIDTAHLHANGLNHHNLDK